MTHRLFSYGTLRQADVQLATFGRLLDGSPDAVIGYRSEVLTVTDRSRSNLVIKELRANAGRVDSLGTGPLLLRHHGGRRSGRAYVSPVAYPAEGDAASVADGDSDVSVVASKAAAAVNPGWFHNVVAAGTAGIRTIPVLKLSRR